MIELVKSSVVFDAESHTYTLGDKKLQGITGMISRQLFPGKYDGVPKFVMNRAADKGSKIHSDCELADLTGIMNCIEAENYTFERQNAGYEPLENEYTVSDNEYFASNIDCVWVKDGEISLADIKTTYSLDEEYLSWQLSTYAYLFELQNPTLKVHHIFGVWLRGTKSKLVEVERKSAEELKRLMECEINGSSYITEVATKESTQILPATIIDAIVELEEAAKEIKSQQEEMKEKLKAAMKEHGIKSWDCEQMKVSYTPETTAKTFDSNKFKEENEELYNQYLKESRKSDSIRITLKTK